MTPPLIERLEAAEVGSRELDIAIGQALGLIDDDLIYTTPAGDRLGRGNQDPWPSWTDSVDRALSLAGRVLPFWAINIDTWGAQNSVVLNECDDEWWHRSGHARIEAKAATPELALCAAILKAKGAGG